MEAPQNWGVGGQKQFTIHLGLLYDRNKDKKREIIELKNQAIQLNLIGGESPQQLCK